MALIEAVSTLFRQKQESNHLQRVWNYDQFKNYLLLLSKGSEFTLPCNQYPERIKLSKNWHDILNEMRQESKDGKERYALIGYKNGSSSLYLPKITTIGENREIPAEIISAKRKKANQIGISPIGNIHSHPTASRSSDRSNYAFSSSDLYGLLVPAYFTRVAGLAETKINLFVFGTKDTETILSPSIFTQDQFNKYWAEQKLNSWDTSMAIAQRYKLVIYSGQPNGELKRKTSL